MLHNVSMVSRVLSLILFPALAVPVLAQAPTTPAAPQGPKPKYPRPPTRDPHTPGYVQSKELPDGTLPSLDADGNFILVPTHPAAPETRTGTASAGKRIRLRARETMDTLCNMRSGGCGSYFPTLNAFNAFRMEHTAPGFGLP